MTVSDTEFGFTFAGTHSRELNIRILDIHRYILPTMTENTQTVPGKRGNIYQGMSLQAKQFDIDIEIESESAEDRAETIHEIAGWLMPLQTGEFDLTFDDEPDYTYYGHCQNAAAITNALYKGTATITFMCSDPLAYGVQQSIDINEFPFEITPDGLSQCFPIFTCIPNKDVTRVAVTDASGNYAYVGSDVDPDTQAQPVDNFPRIINDRCSTFGTGWAPVPTSPTFYLVGTISSDAAIESAGDSFQITNFNSFGAKVSGQWHGAGIQYYLPTSYSDFRIRARMFNNQHYARAEGKIEIYLLNSSGQRIGRLYLKDQSTGDDVYALAELWKGTTKQVIYFGEGTVRNKRNKTVTYKIKNGTKTVTSMGKKKTVQVYKTINLTENLESGTFTDFYGYIQLQKIGNVYTVEIMKLDSNANPEWSKPITATFTDKNNVFGDSIAGVALYIAKYDISEDSNGISYENNHMALTNLEIWNILNGGVNEAQNPEVIARAGDEIKINTEDGQVYKNGALFMDNFFAGSEMPKMFGSAPNTYAFEPSLDDAAWSMDYRPTKP